MQIYLEHCKFRRKIISKKLKANYFLIM